MVGTMVEKKTRQRIIFTQSQLAYFEQEYIKNPYANQDRQTYIAHQLGVTKDRVKIWFQNRRAKDKRLQTDHPAVLKRRTENPKELERSEAEESRRYEMPETPQSLQNDADFQLNTSSAFSPQDPLQETPDKVTPTKRKYTKKSPPQFQHHFHPMFPYNNYLTSMNPGLQMMPPPFPYINPYGMAPGAMPQFTNPSFPLQMPTPPFSPYPGIENIVSPLAAVEENQNEVKLEIKTEENISLTSL